MCRSLACFVLGTFLWQLAFANQASIYWIKGKLIYKQDVFDESACAFGKFSHQLNQTGWNVLDIKTNPKSCKDNEAMFSAGYLEAVFTARDIWFNYLNMRGFFFPEAEKMSTFESKLKQFFLDQYHWARGKVADNPKDSYWQVLGYVLSHFDGLAAGYAKFAEPGWSRDRFVIDLLNGVGDLIDLRHVLNKNSRPNFDEMSRNQMKSYVSKSGHCSALVKVLGAFENLFMAHSSWFTYASTNRIFKHYNFVLQDESVAAPRMSFSSYPGYLESLDDFYMMSSDLVLLQTTNNIFNMSLYDIVTSQSLLAWQRVRLANFLSVSGKGWAKIFARYNSGTYNNQYMVIDLKKIHLNQRIDDDALWVIEQIPGHVLAGDQTNILRNGYWPSYNVPFYKFVYDLSGYPKYVAKFGPDFSYQMAPRAKIFRRDQDLVQDMSSMKHIMRYNNYKNDSYTEVNPCDTICCRGDLAQSGADPVGCYDSKVTDYKSARMMKAWIINGPTTAEGLPPFAWSEKFAKTPHFNLPRIYKYDWMLTQPNIM